MEDKHDIDAKNKKSAPRKGRRAGLALFSLSNKDSGTNVESNDNDVTAPHFRDGRCGGWAEETMKSSRGRNLPMNDMDQSGSILKEFDDGIPVIPNLEENTDEEFIDEIAKAPMIGIKRVATYKELEIDLLKHTAFANLEEVNLRILTNNLYPESALSEPDEQWTKDTLFSEIISAVNIEREKEVK